MNIKRASIRCYLWRKRSGKNKYFACNSHYDDQNSPSVTSEILLIDITNKPIKDRIMQELQFSDLGISTVGVQRKKSKRQKQSYRIYASQNQER